MPGHLIADQASNRVVPAEDNTEHLSLKDFGSTRSFAIVWSLQRDIQKSLFEERK
jgi:hypothetical protein